MNEHMLLVGRSRELHRKCKELGVRSTLLVEMSKVTNEKIASVYDRIMVLPDTARPSDWVEAASMLHSLDKFTCIGAFTELHEKEAVLISERLRIPFHSYDIIEVTHEKDKMRNLMCSKGLDKTSYIRLPADSSEEQVIEAILRIGLPVVLKPANARGSLAVRKIFNQDQIKGALTEYRLIASAYDLLIEKLIEGTELSVEAFSELGVHRIMAVTEKFKDDLTSVETGHLLPARITEGEYQRVIQYVKRVLTSIGIENGPSHTEIFLSKDSPVLIESHVRLGGDRIPDLIQYLTGKDILALWVRQATGQSVLSEVPEIRCVHNKRWASIQYGWTKKSGRISRIDIRDMAEQKSIKEVRPLVQVGDHVDGFLRDSFSRSKEAIAVGESTDEALSVAKNALNYVNLEVEL